ncbi:MAG: hypothetical protein ACOZF0_09610 [Thermodesulfobacteriota bacterium]
MKPVISRTILGIALLLVISAPSASAAIINITAKTNGMGSPVIGSFLAGEYEVTPIGIAEGGKYNAWNPWGWVLLPTLGWSINYMMSSEEFQIGYLDATVYATDLNALATATSTRFTLQQDSEVRFYVPDSYFLDNVGGVSLMIEALSSPAAANPVPIPSALWLFGTGICLLLGITRKKANS